MFPFTKSMQNDLIAISSYNMSRDQDCLFNRVKYYNFMIHDQQ